MRMEDQYKDPIEPARSEQGEFLDEHELEAMLGGLVDFTNDLGRSPTTKEVDGNGVLPNHRTYVRRFKAPWNDVLRMAGIRVEYGSDPIDIVDRIVLFMELNGGVAPTSRQCTRQNNLPSRPTIESRLDLSFLQAIELAKIKFKRLHPNFETGRGW